MRVGALAWLLGPAALGAAAVVSRPLRAVVLAGTAATACWAALVAARGSLSDAGRPAHGSPGRQPASSAGDCRPSVSVVIAARDEACVLPGLLADLAAQDLRAADGTALFDVSLVDDHSVDATFRVMEEAGLAGIVPVASVVRLREGVSDGKAGALRAIPPSKLAGEFVCVLDADARIPPSFLREALAEAQAHGAVTARRRIIGRDGSAWAAVQDDEQTVDAFIQRGRRALGGYAEFRGDGMIVERRLLEDAGGWARYSLTEDLELSTRLAIMGIPVAVPPALVVSEAPVLGLRAFRAQRMRWAEGSLRRFLAHGPAVLGSPRSARTARLEFALYACQLAAPPLFVGALVGGILRRRPALPAALAAAYLAGGAALAYRALSSDPERESVERPGLARRALRVALFGAAWTAVVPASLMRLALRRRPPIHAPTPHRWMGPR